ncbi:MAG: nucleoside monophosphate kinase [Candidatus Taylorbacteria bacterium]|nr:nucleoside monophosphate kinase [Candidatus Taylorbacteria bacterium]
MSPQIFIFIGRSGCGKGTQAALLSNYLKEVSPERSVFYLQIGEEFREFIKGDTYTQKLAKKIHDAGGLVPEFLAVYFWSRRLAQEYRGLEHLVIDGTPRKFHEAGVLHSIFDFYKFSSAYVVYLNVSKEWAVEKLKSRGRVDDNEQDIEARLAWFETDVLPAVEFYRKNSFYRFVEVNGEQSVEAVWKDVRKGVGFNE